MTSSITTRLFRLPLTLLMCVALLLPSCAAPGDDGDDPTDICRPQRAALRSTGDYFAQDILIGAAGGALAGGLVGLAAGGNARSALIGALAGGALGAAGGYFAARQKQYADQAQLYRAIYTDVERDNQTIDKTQLAFNQLVACRNNEAARIRADYRAGRISRDVADAAMARVRAHAASDLRLAASISNHIQQRSADFSNASDQVQAQNGRVYAAPVRPGRRPVQAARPVTPASQVQVATSTNLAKRDQFQQSIAAAQSTRYELAPT